MFFFIIYQNLKIDSPVLQLYRYTRTVYLGSLYKTPSLVLVYQQSSTYSTKLVPVEGKPYPGSSKKHRSGKWVPFEDELSLHRVFSIYATHLSNAQEIMVVSGNLYTALELLPLILTILI